MTILSAIDKNTGEIIETTHKKTIISDIEKQPLYQLWHTIYPRGPLSEESVYGKIKTIEKNKAVKYLFENPHLVFKPYIRVLINERLAKFDNDTKKALASLKKEPIYLNAEKTKVLEYATCFKDEYVLKYPIGTIKAKDTEFIIDSKVKELVVTRLAQFNNKEKEAFKSPLYFNEEKGIEIKTVRMRTGLTAVESVKKDESGKEIGFVKPGNNHHIAFYKDENGKKVEHGCTFWHAVERKKYGFPVIIKNPKEVWDRVIVNKDDYPKSFLEKLPNDKWLLDMSLQQNEMFILGVQQDIFEKAIKENNKKLLNNNLYRTQKLAERNYVFRHHLETQINDSNESKISNRFYLIQSISAFEKLNPQKITINNLGEIVT